jgi:hypothetical protein
MDGLLQQRHYVELERALLTSTSVQPSTLAYFQGVMANRVNDVQKSISLLEPLIPKLVATSPVRAELALCTLADDYAKTFRYGKAAALYAQANRVAGQLGKRSECRADTEASQWGLLSNAQAQTVSAPGEFSIGGKRDTLGFFQVPITSGKYIGSWAISSGTKLSVVTRSVANKLDLKISTGSGRDRRLCVYPYSSDSGESCFKADLLEFKPILLSAGLKSGIQNAMICFNGTPPPGVSLPSVNSAASYGAQQSYFV